MRCKMEISNPSNNSMVLVENLEEQRKASCKSR